MGQREGERWGRGGGGREGREAHLSGAGPGVSRCHGIVIPDPRVACMVSTGLRIELFRLLLYGEPRAPVDDRRLTSNEDTHSFADPGATKGEAMAASSDWPTTTLMKTVLPTWYAVTSFFCTFTFFMVNLDGSKALPAVAPIVPTPPVSGGPATEPTTDPASEP